MSSTNQRRKSARITAWITPDLKAKVDQVVTQQRKQQRDYTTADLVRAAIRQLIDQQAEIMGSKAHQVRTFKFQADRLVHHLDTLEARLALLGNITLQLLATVSAVQLKSSRPASAVDPQGLIDLAVRAAHGATGQATWQHIARLAAPED
jgi:hypothetical protein